MENVKHLKKKVSEKLMPISWYSKQWRKFSMPKHDKKEINLY